MGLRFFIVATLACAAACGTPPQAPQTRQPVGPVRLPETEATEPEEEIVRAEDVTTTLCADVTIGRSSGLGKRHHPVPVALDGVEHPEAAPGPTADRDSPWPGSCAQRRSPVPPQARYVPGRAA